MKSLASYLSSARPASNPAIERFVEMRLANAGEAAWQHAGEARTVQEAIDVAAWAARRASAGVWLLSYRGIEWAAEGGELVRLPRPYEQLTEKLRGEGDAAERWLEGADWEELWEHAPAVRLLLEAIRRFAPPTRLIEAAFACAEAVEGLVGFDWAQGLISAARARMSDDPNFGVLAGLASSASAGSRYEDYAACAVRSALAVAAYPERKDRFWHAKQAADLAVEALLREDDGVENLQRRRGSRASEAHRARRREQFEAELAERVRRAVPFEEVVRGVMRQAGLPPFE